jgi:hypothetical protein
MKKSFDCVEMQHRGGQHVQRLIAGLTMDEQVAFWRHRTEEFRRRQARVRSREAGRAVGDDH